MRLQDGICCSKSRDFQQTEDLCVFVWPCFLPICMALGFLKKKLVSKGCNFQEDQLKTLFAWAKEPKLLQKCKGLELVGIQVQNRSDSDGWSGQFSMI